MEESKLIIPVQSISDLKPFKEESEAMSSLRIFEHHPIPPGTTILLKTEVFDGIGDLEHVIQAARHLRRLQKQETFKIMVLLEHGNNVSSKAWDEKLASLHEIVDETYICFAEQREEQSYSPEIKAFAREMQKLKPTMIDVSYGLDLFDEFQFMQSPSAGFIEEYFHGHTVGEEAGKLATGLRVNTAGVWMEDDETFVKKVKPLSVRAIHQLYGDEFLTEPEEGWSIGFASLRSDTARLSWMDAELYAIPANQNCSLVISACRENCLQQIRDLAARHDFTDLVILQPDGSILRIEIPPNSGAERPKKILRVINQFVAEDDMAPVLQRARNGCLGGAGDTAFARGLAGKFPVFAEERQDVTGRVARASLYLKSAGYPLLAQWFQDLNRKPVMGTLPSVSPFTKELMDEWHHFQKEDLPRLNIGPWVTLLVRRAAWANLAESRDPELGDRFREIENDYIDGQYNLETYQQKMEDLLQKLSGR